MRGTVDERAHLGGTHLFLRADGLTMRRYGGGRFERARGVARAADEIKWGHGRDTVRFGAARPGGRRATKSLRRSPAYTTRLAEALRVA